MLTAALDEIVPSPAEEVPVAVSLVGLQKHYGKEVHALRGIDLRIYRGEFVTLLGPSGSGKTTLLMTVAGFERPSSGRILAEGLDITDLPPQRRNFGVVFQSYALFPHMTVRSNVAYPLAARRVARKERHKRVNEVLSMVGLDGLEDRRPAQLSGGQQQRVALARALVYRPTVLLLDEPLGALDRALRERMQLELRRLHQMLGVTFIYVTHDQDEALSMSDRVVVIKDGLVEQVDTPEAIYARPASEFVAKFVGTANLLEAQVVAVEGDLTRLLLEDGSQVSARSNLDRSTSRATVVVRPEKLTVNSGPAHLAGSTGFQGSLQEEVFRGNVWQYRIRGPAVDVEAHLPRPLGADLGATVWVSWDYQDAWLLAR